MGREVRMVKRGWEHPKDESGKHVALYDGDFEHSYKEWSEGYALWQQGLRDDMKGGVEPIDKKYQGMRYTDYNGSCPSPDDYMPKWEEGEATMLVMYETTSEGTPISPPFETSEELARWLVDNNASSFGSNTATYEQWLKVCKGGWAPSMVIQNGKMMSGVEAMAETSTETT